MILTEITEKKENVITILLCDGKDPDFFHLYSIILTRQL